MASMIVSMVFLTCLEEHRRPQAEPLEHEALMIGAHRDHDSCLFQYFPRQRASPMGTSRPLLSR
jgi:hypothetical protein